MAYKKCPECGSERFSMIYTEKGSDRVSIWDNGDYEVLKNEWSETEVDRFECFECETEVEL